MNWNKKMFQFMNLYLCLKKPYTQFSHFTKCPCQKQGLEPDQATRLSTVCDIWPSHWQELERACDSRRPSARPWAEASFPFSFWDGLHGVPHQRGPNEADWLDCGVVDSRRPAARGGLGKGPWWGTGTGEPALGVGWLNWPRKKKHTWIIIWNEREGITSDLIDIRRIRTLLITMQIHSTTLLKCTNFFKVTACFAKPIQAI